MPNNLCEKGEKMKYTFHKVLLSGLTLGLLLGCGNSTSSVDTRGTGYYIDSAVQGINYECGGINGVTDKDGKFTFETGKDCEFKVADVSLRKVKASALSNNISVIENNVTVARFLQSIDNDGNATNGIHIEKDTIDSIKKGIEDKKFAGQVPTEESVLKSVVDEIKANTPTFAGKVKTEAETKAHLAETTKKIVADSKLTGTQIKKILAGKSLYLNNNHTNPKFLMNYAFNSDASELIVSSSGSPDSTKKFTCSVVTGDKFLCKHSGAEPTGKEFTKEKFFTLVQTDNAIILDEKVIYTSNGISKNYDNGSTTYYLTKEDALKVAEEKYKLDPYGKLNATQTKTFLSGKTLYQFESIPYNGSNIEFLRTRTFNSDASTQTFKYSNSVDSFDATCSIVDNQFICEESAKGVKYLLTAIRHYSSSGFGLNIQKSFKSQDSNTWTDWLPSSTSNGYYFTEEDAKKHPNTSYSN